MRGGFTQLPKFSPLRWRAPVGTKGRGLLEGARPHPVGHVGLGGRSHGPCFWGRPHKAVMVLGGGWLPPPAQNMGF